MLKLNRLAYIPHAFRNNDTILCANFSGSCRDGFCTGQAVDFHVGILIHSNRRNSCLNLFHERRAWIFMG